MWDNNPDLIQDPDRSSPEASLTPLVLVHDGGGTTFSYHCMHPALGRPVWAIANPRFHTGVPWAGGLPEMARNYVTMLRNAIGRGPIILGGWSLGGLISLEMARLLAGDRWLRVVGIIMIDSVCPLTLRVAPAQQQQQQAGADGDGDVGAKMASPAQIAVATEHAFSSMTKPDTKAKVKRCFAESSAMVYTWALPEWGDDDTSRPRVSSGATTAAAAAGSPLLPPPAILLRAQESVPTEEDDVARVDLARHDRMLGWDQYRPDLFREVVDIPGHHYNIFTDANVDAVRTALIDACESLEDLA
ncbi:hypothetical protein RB595_007603 [Gaeumannomyces hyphopodioides]